MVFPVRAAIVAAVIVVMVIVTIVVFTMLIMDASGYHASHNAPSTSRGRASGRRPSNARCYPGRQSAV
jgi:hypothetical protein